MSILTKLSVNRLLKQKFIYVFFVCFLVASFFYAFLISSPEMEEALNINIALVGGANFPEFMLRFYIGIVGTLFTSFLIVFYVCEEERNGMLFQPLLHGKTRNNIMKAKVVVFTWMSFIFVVLIYIINYVVSYIRWGSLIFDKSTMIRVLIKYALNGIYMVSITLGIIMACTYLRNTLKTLIAVIAYLIIDTVISGLSIPVIKYIYPGQYSYDWLMGQEFKPVTVTSAVCGTIIIILYGIIFYNFTMKKFDKVNF